MSNVLFVSRYFTQYRFITQEFYKKSIIQCVKVLFDYIKGSVTSDGFLYKLAYFRQKK